MRFKIKLLYREVDVVWDIEKEEKKGEKIMGH